MSSYNQIFQDLHGALDFKQVTSAETYLMKKYPDRLQAFYEVCSYLEVEPEYIKFDKLNSFRPIFYFNEKNYNYIPIETFDIEGLEMLNTKLRIETFNERLSSLIMDKEYRLLFTLMDKKLVIPSFIALYPAIPDNQKYDVFADLYTRSEYGFENLSRVIEGVYKHAPASEKWQEHMKELDKATSGDLVTIYRGHKKDRSLSTAYSWTLSKKTAEFFAERFQDGKGKVLKAQIPKSAILDYFTGRTESEVLVMPRDITHWLSK